MNDGGVERRFVFALLILPLLIFQFACFSKDENPDLLRNVSTGRKIDTRFLLPRQYLTFGNDGKAAAAASLENSALYLHVWNTETGKEIFVTPMDDKGDYVFTDASRSIVVKLKDEIRVFNVSDGSLLRTYSFKLSSRDLLSRLVASGDELFLLSSPLYYSQAQRATIWNIKENKPVQGFDLGDRNGITDVALSHDGVLLAIGYGNRDLNDTGPDTRSYGVDIFRISDGKLTRRLEGHRGGVTHVSFSPDGQVLASAGGQGDGRLRLWRIADGTPLAEFSVQEPSALQRLRSNWKQLRSTAFSNDGQMIAFAGSDEVVYVVSLSKGQILKTLKGHNNIILGVTFTSDSSELMSADADGVIITWKL